MQHSRVECSCINSLNYARGRYILRNLPNLMLLYYVQRKLGRRIRAMEEVACRFFILKETSGMMMLVIKYGIDYIVFDLCTLKT